MEPSAGGRIESVTACAADGHGDRGGQGQVTLPGFAAALAVAMGIGPLLIYGLTAAGPLVIADLHLSRAQFGSFATVAFASAAVSSGVCGRLIDVYSERTTLLALYVASAGALALAAVAQSYLAVVVAVILSGCAQSLSNPVTNRLISSYAPARARGTLMGVKQSGVQMAQLSAGLVIPGLALLIGWRGGLAVAILIAAVGILITWRHVPRRSSIGTGRRSSVGGALPSAVWWLTAYAMLTGAALQASNVYMPLYGYEELDLSVASAGLTTAVLGGVGLVARIAWGRAADRMSSPRLPLLVLSLVAGFGAACIFLAGSLHSTALLWGGAVLFGASGVAANVVVMVAVLQVSPRQVIGRASGVLAIGLYLGFALGPVSFGAVVDSTGRYDIGWIAVVMAFVAAAVLVLVGRNGLRPPSTSTA